MILTLYVYFRLFHLIFTATPNEDVIGVLLLFWPCFHWLMILLSVVTESLKAKCAVTGLLKLQVEQRRMDLPLPLKTVMGATAWQQWQQEIAVKMVSKSAFRLSTNDSSVMATSYICWTSTMRERGHRDFIEDSTVGVLWQKGCNRNGSNLTIYTCVLKALHLRVPQLYICV